MTPNALQLLRIGDEIAEVDAVGNVVLDTRQEVIMLSYSYNKSIIYVETDSGDYRCYPFYADSGRPVAAEWDGTGAERTIDIVKLV